MFDGTEYIQSLSSLNNLHETDMKHNNEIMK